MYGGLSPDPAPQPGSVRRVRGRLPLEPGEVPRVPRFSRASLNLLRQEAIATTEEPSVAFIYKAGLDGLAIRDDTNLDPARAWQAYEFGGEPKTNLITLRARNRLEILDAGEVSPAIFPPPRKFFVARENEISLGYVYYKKNAHGAVALGVMQPEQRTSGAHSPRSSIRSPKACLVHRRALE